MRLPTQLPICGAPRLKGASRARVWSALALAALVLSAPISGLSAPKTAPAAGGPASSAKRFTALDARVVLKVADPTKARKALLARVAKLRGHPALITDRRLHVRVPPKQLDSFLAFVNTQGYVIDKQLTRRDLTEAIARTRGRLRSKATTLAQLRSFLDDSKVAATLQVERTMTAIITELERLKGRLRVDLSRAAMAQVQISFQFRNPTRLRYVRSPFAWINSVDVQKFLREF